MDIVNCPASNRPCAILYVHGVFQRREIIFNKTRDGKRLERRSWLIGCIDCGKRGGLAIPDGDKGEDLPGIWNSYEDITTPSLGFQN